MSQGLGPAFDRAQARWDAMLPPDDSPMRVCSRCKEEYNEDAQELDSQGKDLCDPCVEAIAKEGE